MRLRGAPLSANVINAIAKGIVVANDRCLLVENGGHLCLSKQWACNISNEIMRTEKKMVRRMATTSKIPVAQRVLLIFDVLRGQTTDSYLKLLDENNFVCVFVPPNLTNYFQPLDLNVSSHAKTFLKQRFQDWYASAVTKQLDAGKDV